MKTDLRKINFGYYGVYFGGTVTTLTSSLKEEQKMPLIDPNEVVALFESCLRNEGDKDSIRVEGIVFDAILNVKGKEEQIIKMLDGLPTSFRLSVGGGMSFLAACQDRNDEQWTGLHQTMSQLFLLGMAAGKVKPCLPKDMWPALPGGMPYYMYLDK